MLLATHTKKNNIFLKINPISLASLYKWGQDIENSVCEPHAKVHHPAPRLFNKQFAKEEIFKTPDSVHRPNAAAFAS